MAAGSLSNIGEPKFRKPEVVRIGNNPPPTTPPGMFVAPPLPDTTWLDLENREYSEFQISVDANFHITTIHANEGARFRLFIYRSNETEITVDINPWSDEQVKVPGTTVSKIFVLNVECYLIPGEDKLRYKVSNLIFDDETRKDKTWSSSKIKETIDAVINDEVVSLTGTWSASKIKAAIDAKEDKIGDSLQVDEIVRKSTAETGGMNFISRSIHKDWGDREDQRPTFSFISRVYDGFGNVVSELIPFQLDGAGKLQAHILNAAYLYLNNSHVATEKFVNDAIQAISDLMSTDAERIAAINELTLNYNAADDQLEQTLTTALAKKAGKAVNEEISGIYNFLNGLKENGVAINSLYLGINATAQNADKVQGIEASRIVYGDNLYGTSWKDLGFDDVLKSGFFYGKDPGLNYGHLIHNQYYFSAEHALQLFGTYGGIDYENLAFRKKHSNVWGAWRKIWHEGNDGAGSGLDADRVDGLQAYQFARSDAFDYISGCHYFNSSHWDDHIRIRRYSDGHYGFISLHRVDTRDNMNIRFGPTANAGLNVLMDQNDTSHNKVGVNKIPVEALDVKGNIVATGSITNGSDRRQKTNIQPLTPRGELNPVTFIKDGKPDLGFIAQEVKEHYPELVAGEETEDTYLTLNYSQITAVLYAELKELRAEVKQLKQLIHNDTNV